MRSLRKPFHVFVFAIFLIMCFSLLTLEARASHGLEHAAITTETTVCEPEHIPLNTETAAYEPEEISIPTEVDAYELEDTPLTTQDYIFSSIAETYAPPAPVVNAISVRGDPFANEIIRLINIERFHKGVAPVEAHPVLTKAARIRAQESLHLDDTRFISHLRPSGQQWYTVLPEMNLSNVSFGRVSENVARRFSTPDEVVRAWMSSPTHRDNLLSPEWVVTGLGVSKNDWGRIDVVQLFCDDRFVVTPSTAESYQSAGYIVQYI